jgi:hypothetical protein
MVKAYVANKLHGIRQVEIGEQLGVSQTTVHRYVNAVEEFRAAGGKVPGLDAPQTKPPKVIPVDPGRLDLDKRRDGRKSGPRDDE